MNQETLLKIINWATGEDTGVSSEALCRFMLGLDATRRFGAPSDADDRGRCIRLLNLIPEWWDRLDEMAKLPSSIVTFYVKNKLETRDEGWREQIPLIKKEALKPAEEDHLEKEVIRAIMKPKKPTEEHKHNFVGLWPDKSMTCTFCGQPAEEQEKE